MEKDFTKLQETMQEFKERRQTIKDNCLAECDRIQTEANKKKIEARNAMGKALIELAREQDDFMIDYREWKHQQQPEPQEQELL